jgi:type IV pilus assembly protein PilY1
MAIGKVIINGNEKWVGFIGAGYPTGTGTTGMGFFVVDLTNGNILWSYTQAKNSSMTYGVPASPTIVDTDSDGFIDTAYVGDLGGNMWRFTFCTNAQGSSCSIAQWGGGLLFQASSGRPIYTAAAMASDSSSLWVFWGTGDKENPTSTTGPDSFFAVMDNDRVTTYSIGNLQNISAQGTTYNGTSSGWYITFAGTGEKMLTDPTVFGGIVLFTTYTPSSATNPCLPAGTSQLYAIAMMNLTISGIPYAPGAGVLSTPSSSASTAGGARSVALGAGMAESPIVSQNPVPGTPTNIYLSLSGGGGQSTNIITSAQLGSSPLNQLLTQTAASSQLLHWRDGRIQ